VVQIGKRKFARAVSSSAPRRRPGPRPTQAEPAVQVSGYLKLSGGGGTRPPSR
jgi:hypothetical protein